MVWDLSGVHGNHPYSSGVPTAATRRFDNKHVTGAICCRSVAVIFATAINRSPVASDRTIIAARHAIGGTIDDWPGSRPPLVRGTESATPVSRDIAGTARRHEFQNSPTTPGIAIPELRGLSDGYWSYGYAPSHPSKSGPRSATQRFVILMRIVAIDEIVHRTLCGGHDAKRTVKRIGDNLRGLDITRNHCGRILRLQHNHREE